MDGVVAATPFSWFGGNYKSQRGSMFAQFGVEPKSAFDVFAEYQDLLMINWKEFKERQASLRRRSTTGRTDGMWKVGDRIPLEGTIYPV